MSAQTDPFIATISKAKLSVIPVACSSWPDDKTQVTTKEIEGTGFFVSYDGHFVTAAHVIKKHFKWNPAGEPDKACFPIIYIPNPTWATGRWFRFGSCIADDTIDVAVCKTSLNPFGEKGTHIDRLHFVSSVPPDGSAVAFTGFPQLILVPVTSRANVAAVATFFDAEQTEILIDKTAWHGVSGAPVYREDGRVVGIVIETGEGIWSGMAFVRHTSTILDFLRVNKIPIWQEGEKEIPRNK
jgi:S1-C subfamily serine protease